MIIECDGEYWHGLDNAHNIRKTNQLNNEQKENVINDFQRTEQLREVGYVVLRFSELEIEKYFYNIEKNLNLFIQILKGEHIGI